MRQRSLDREDAKQSKRWIDLMNSMNDRFDSVASMLDQYSLCSNTPMHDLNQIFDTTNQSPRRPRRSAFHIQSVYTPMHIPGDLLFTRRLVFT